MKSKFFQLDPSNVVLPINLLNDMYSMLRSGVRQLFYKDSTVSRSKLAEILKKLQLPRLGTGIIYLDVDTYIKKTIFKRLDSDKKDTSTVPVRFSIQQKILKT